MGHQGQARLALLSHPCLSLIVIPTPEEIWFSPRASVIHQFLYTQSWVLHIRIIFFFQSALLPDSPMSDKLRRSQLNAFFRKLPLSWSHSERKVRHTPFCCYFSYKRPSSELEDDPWPSPFIICTSISPVFHGLFSLGPQHSNPHVLFTGCSHWAFVYWKVRVLDSGAVWSISSLCQASSLTCTV